MGIDKSSERMMRINLKGGQVYPLRFTDTKPNILQFRNLSSNIVYMDYSPSVNNNSYMFNVIGGGTRIFTSPKDLFEVYLYAQVDTTIIVTSWVSNEMFANDLDQTQQTVILNNSVGANVNVLNEVEVKNEAGNPLNVSVVSPFTTEFKCGKYTLVAGVDTTVKASTTYCGGIFTSLSDVIMKNGASEVWKAIPNNINFSTPVKFSSNLVLNSPTGGVVYLVYM